ncbi:MAG: hypothetical protein J6B60_05925 [Clostridia bacterium]|nr:hypothetical protein [Clostridia bacterium]
MIFKTKFKENEYFWGGEAASGTEMPINAKSDYCRDFRTYGHRIPKRKLERRKK